MYNLCFKAHGLQIERYIYEYIYIWFQRNLIKQRGSTVILKEMIKPKEEKKKEKRKINCPNLFTNIPFAYSWSNHSGSAFRNKKTPMPKNMYLNTL